jgi:hypothetical protein
MKPTTGFKTLLLLFVMFTAVGCIGPHAVIDDLRANPGSGALIEDVPFFPQDELMCGPAALLSVIEYLAPRAWQDGQGAGSADERLNVITREVYSEQLDGTLPMDLLIYAKRKGFAAEYYEGGLEDLKEKLSDGTPLILFLNLGIDAYPIGHYIVAVGYNDRLKKVLAHSGLKSQKVYSYGWLLRAWSKTGFSTLLITPQANPRTVPEEGM